MKISAQTLTEAYDADKRFNRGFQDGQKSKTLAVPFHFNWTESHFDVLYEKGYWKGYREKEITTVEENIYLFFRSLCENADGYVDDYFLDGIISSLKELILQTINEERKQK